ncbi:MAG TPA: bifunctional diguanylate cyclase/phosphodiesterase [Mycobacteriales bacterium]|nr:bifunctional diguanylate cyclase/phosphodiesterase [Mycobacteriales bacterium]
MAVGTDTATLPVRRYWAGRVVWVAPILCALPVWLFAPRSADGLGGLLPWLSLFAVFAVTEPLQLHFEFRRQTYSLSLVDIPLCAGLFILPMGGLVLSRVCANALTLPYFVLAKRRSLGKQAFNAANHLLDALVASAIFTALSERRITEPRAWLVAAVAILATSVTGPLLVAFAIGVTQAMIRPAQVLNILVRSVIFGLLGTTLCLVGLIVVSVSPFGAIMLAVLLLVSAFGYRAYGQFLRRHGDLGRVYAFSRLVDTSRADPSGLATALEWLREAFNATSVRLYVQAAKPTARFAMLLDENGPVASPAWRRDSLHKRLDADRHGLLVTRGTPVDPVLQDALNRRGVGELMAVRLGASSRVLGYLELHDRQGQVTFFSTEDLRLLESLAAHLSAALENQQLVGRLRHDAYHDRLTGLPNRERLAASIDAAIAAATDSGQMVAVLLLDLDSFKDVNDSLGHDHGDRLLVMFAKRLREQATGGAVAARMGADEFALLCVVPDLASAERRARTLHEMLSIPYPLAGLSVRVGASVGVAVAPDHAHDAGTLLQRADVALYAAKSKGQPVATYLPSLDQASVHRLQLVTQLREALDTGQVTAHFQPKIGMATRDLVGVEALVRWEHPQYGSVVPDDFVPLAERTGLIGPLTMHVLAASLRQCRHWLDRDLRIGVAVNLSVRNLLDADFPDRVTDLLADTGTPPDLLTLEITESSVMSDPERSLPVLHRLHELGIGLSIDDFGTGYSSLAYLRRLPVDEVKIDKVFVLGMGTDLGDLAIVRAIIELGHSLGLRVVAEGVEDELARDLLEGMDCDVAQGYLISRALASDRLDAWLTARTVARPSQPGVRGRKLQVAG